MRRADGMCAMQATSAMLVRMAWRFTDETEVYAAPSGSQAISRRSRRLVWWMSPVISSSWQ